MTAKTAKKTGGKSNGKAASIQFSLLAPEASAVQLAGDFNNWDQNEAKMRRMKDGTWKKSMPLKPGRYEYLFLVDGQWWTDPANGERVGNSYGTENSVITVG